MKGAWDQNIIFRVFSELHKICVHAKFQSGMTPPSGFFANTYPIFCKYMTGIFVLQYFNSSLKSELELSYMDQN